MVVDLVRRSGTVLEIPSGQEIRRRLPVLHCLSLVLAARRHVRMDLRMVQVHARMGLLGHLVLAVRRHVRMDLRTVQDRVRMDRRGLVDRKYL